jgi:glycosyltransferase involved in cell wall biosynthesis
MTVILIPHDFQDHYTIGLANGIASNGMNLILISSDSINKQKLMKNVIQYNLRRRHRKNRSQFEKVKKILRYYFKLIKFVFSNKYSILHVCGGIRKPIIEGIIINYIMKLLSKRIILTVHNLLPHDNDTKFKRFIYKIIYYIPDYLIVHTSKMKDLLISEFDICPLKIFIMEHGINDAVPIYDIEVNQCRRNLKVPTGKTVFLFFGNIAPYKGLDILLQTFDKMDNQYFLIIAGREKSQKNKKYNKKIEHLININKNKHNILKKIIYIPDEEVALYFNATDALIMPYRQIYQSGVIFLALRFGIPIIAFDVGSLSDYINDTIGVIVEENKPEVLMQALTKFSENKRKFCKKKIKQMANRFAWSEVVKPILPLYHDAIPKNDIDI